MDPGEEGELKHCSSVTTRGIHAWTQEGDVFQTSYVLIFLKAFFFRSLNKVPEVKRRRKGGELTFELGVEVQLEKTDGAESVSVEAQVIG